MVDLAEIRKNLQLTQEQAAARSGVTRAFYSMIELGLRRPSVENAKKSQLLLTSTGRVLRRSGREIFQEA